VGKFKTTLQIIAIVVLLLFNPARFPLMKMVGLVALYAAALLTLWSMLVYLRAAWPSFRTPPKQDGP
jgi:CDP-diacylglycerol--glycerol-3-phosphate 3-phosphatidyltransferase